MPFMKGNITILGIPHVEKLGVHPGLTLEMIHQEWKDSCASQSVHHHFSEMMIWAPDLTYDTTCYDLPSP